MKFCNARLIQIRESLRINKAEAARRLNMSAMGYGRYESGEREPSFQTVSFMASVLGTTTDFLYGKTDDASIKTITISADDDPDIFLLLETLNNNNALAKRLLLYLSKIKES